MGRLVAVEHDRRLQHHERADETTPLKAGSCSSRGWSRSRAAWTTASSSRLQEVLGIVHLGVAFRQVSEVKSRSRDVRRVPCQTCPYLCQTAETLGELRDSGPFWHFSCAKPDSAKSEGFCGEVRLSCGISCTCCPTWPRPRPAYRRRRTTSRPRNRAISDRIDAPAEPLPDLGEVALETQPPTPFLTAQPIGLAREFLRKP